MLVDKIEIIDLNHRPELIETTAQWFHSKWKVPEKAYIDSMKSSLDSENGVPHWYIIIHRGKIIAGLGAIENDFHKRPDLTPNICAVYVEKRYRKKGIARMLLDNACADLADQGIHDVYLITSHTDFYEHCGWTFYGMIEENDGNMIRMYHHKS